MPANPTPLATEISSEGNDGRAHAVRAASATLLVEELCGCPLPELTKEHLERQLDPAELEPGVKGSNCVAHVLAALGALDLLPRHLITPELLRLRERPTSEANGLGLTVAHRAALHRHTATLPRELLTPELLALTAGAGSSVFFDAVMAGDSSAIPPTSFTPELMRQQGPSGLPLIHSIAS